MDMLNLNSIIIVYEKRLGAMTLVNLHFMISLILTIKLVNTLLTKNIAIEIGIVGIKYNNIF